MPKNYKIAFGIYLILLVLTVFSIRSILAVEKVPVGDVDEEKTETKVREIDVTINVNSGTSTKTYKTKTLSVDSVYDALDNLREDQGFTFEYTDYAGYEGSRYVTYIDIDEVNSVKTNQYSIWKIYYGEKVITNQFKELKFSDDYTIDLKYETR